MKFYITPEKQKHLLRHFTENKTSGSKFNPALFPTPEALINYINSIIPYYVFPQGNNAMVYCFRSISGECMGLIGIANRRDVPLSDIVTENRDGHLQEIGEVNELPETEEFCVIATRTAIGNSIITAFPGPYAPPYPDKRQSKEDLEYSRLFWDTHVLLRCRK